jgi:alkylation response protein AidB-like acyl-CoA dehydrogenase
MDYQPRTADAWFLIDRVLQLPNRLSALYAHAGVDADLMRQVLDESAKFVADVIAPLNRVGDEQGARWDQGRVTMPPGFREAYQAFWQAGWPALACDPADGGQGLPTVLEATLYEMLSAANHGWTMAPGLLHGAYECIKHHASPELRALYLDKVASGEWLATMCLTEPHAGSDLGLVRTRAKPLPDGRYALNGSKIFISGGEHDLTDNIVHLVLARLPDAPPGPKGLSLFLVPKFDPQGQRSAVHCDRIEEKMGLHGSPTCAMRFDDAVGWLVGEPGKGLGAMFLMMNAARLHVALQGIGLLDAAWQKADAYARERRQMRAPLAKRQGQEADLIIEHPAVRRLLDTQRAWIDAGRWLAYRTALELDRARHDPDPAARASAQRWCALATPVLKSLFTQQAFEGASQCLQVLGGHGYVREWGIEQHVRDARVTMIYEGTNEIQAIDLLLRKVLPDAGQGLQALMWEELSHLPEADSELEQRARVWAELTTQIAQRREPAHLPHELADDYLRGLGLWMLQLAWRHIDAHRGELPGDEQARWQQASTALHRWVLPEWQLRVQIMRDTLARHPMALLEHA